MLSFWIRSRYTDAALSRYRLEISKLTAIPSLRAQQQASRVVLLVAPNDPYRHQRVEAWRSTGLEVAPVTTWPAHRGLCSRMDDDDIISPEYVSKVQESGMECDALTAVDGSILTQNGAWGLTHHNSMFVTTRDRFPYEFKHTEPDRFGTSIQLRSSTPLWIWVRHQCNASPMCRRWIDGRSLDDVQLHEWFPQIAFSRLLQVLQDVDQGARQGLESDLG